MVTVGDDNRVLLFNISYSGNYELMQTMAGKEKKKTCISKKLNQHFIVSKDANFSIAWNHTSDKFAVSSQDGSVHVWDIRHSDPLAKFTSVHVRIKE